MLLWLKDLWENTLKMLRNDRGIIEGDGEGEEADNAEGTAESDNANDTGEEGEGTGEGEGGTGEGQGGEEEGEADNVDPELKQLFGGDFSKLGKSYRELQAKHKPIEMNNAAMRTWAEKNGLKIVTDAKGNFKTFELDTSKPTAEERKRMFTDEHSKQFDSFFNIEKNPKAGENFRELLKLFITDLQTDAFAERDSRMMAAAKFRNEERETEKFIAKVYPDANPDNPNFPEGGTPLYNRATEIYEANESYQHHPKGQLFAVHEAAIELGVQPATIAAAKAAGKKEGIEGKRILGKIGAAGTGKGAGGIKKTGEWSLDDFMKASPKERLEYQEKQLKKKSGG